MTTIGIGLVCFLVAGAYQWYTMGISSSLTGVSVIVGISGVIVEVLAGIMFALYAKMTTQLQECIQELEQIQRFLLADSMCQRIGGQEYMAATRAALAIKVATFGSN